MKQSLFIISLSTAIVSIFSCNAQQEKIADNLDEFCRKTGDSLLTANKVPGIFVGILDNGRRKYYNFGFADPDKKMVFDSNTVFEIGSITKTFTAYALESVLLEKSIADSSSIIPWLPDSVRQNKELEKISFRSLLNHTSGLPRLPDNMDLFTHAMAPYDYYTLADLFAYLKTCKPTPDGHSNYSNLGVGLAGVIAERISGKSYKTLLNDYIFSPFRITYHPDESIAALENKSQGYFEGNKAAYWNADALAPAGTLKCSAAEMLGYFQCMSAPVNKESRRIIDKLLEQTVRVGPKVSVCRAWHTIEEQDKPVIYWHNGGTYGFSTFGAFIREKNKAVIVVINQFNKNATSDQLGIMLIKKLVD